LGIRESANEWNLVFSDGDQERGFPKDASSK